MLIRDLTIVDPEEMTCKPGELRIQRGLFASRSARHSETLEGSGLFALPGLIDAHVHIVPFPGSPGVPSSRVLASAVRSLRNALKAGVTTVRDLGCDLSIALAARSIASSGSACSRLLIAGPMLSIPDGHGTGSCHGLGLSDQAEGIAMTGALATAGVDFIKVVSSGANGRHQMSRDLMQVVIAEARARGLCVAVHAHLQTDQIAAAVELGARTIEHGFLLHALPATIERMRADDVSLCPTLRVVEAMREDPTWRGQRLVPAAWDDALTSVRVAAEAGVRLIVGTDAGVFGVGFDAAWREITLVSTETGSRWQGLRAATCSAAAALRLSDLGSFRPGARADAVFLRRNPADQVVTSADVVAVMRDGRIVHGVLG
jgi:imidazolonepropionase-like amidohydrolase